MQVKFFWGDISGNKEALAKSISQGWYVLPGSDQTSVQAVALFWLTYTVRSSRNCSILQHNTRINKTTVFQNDAMWCQCIVTVCGSYLNACMITADIPDMDRLVPRAREEIARVLRGHGHDPHIVGVTEQRVDTLERRRVPNANRCVIWARKQVISRSSECSDRVCVALKHRLETQRSAIPHANGLVVRAYTSVAVILAEILLRSLRKLFIFIINKYVGSKYPTKNINLISKKAFLHCTQKRPVFLIQPNWIFHQGFFLLLFNKNILPMKESNPTTYRLEQKQWYSILSNP